MLIFNKFHFVNYVNKKKIRLIAMTDFLPKLKFKKLLIVRIPSYFRDVFR